MSATVTALSAIEDDMRKIAEQIRALKNENETLRAENARLHAAIDAAIAIGEATLREPR